MKSVKPLFIATIALVISSCGKSDKQDKQAVEVIPVSLLAISSNTNTLPIMTSAKLTTDDEVSLSFTTSGIIDNILVKEGDAVSKGQLLATLNTTEARAREQQFFYEKEMAERNFQRTENLYAENVASKEQYQNDKTTMEVAIQKWKAANFDLQNTRIRAVKNGYILKKMVEAGSRVSAGTPVITMFGGQRSGKWIAKTEVNDRQWMSINEGDKAEVYFDNDGEKIQGEVTAKSQSAATGSGSYSIDVLLKSDHRKQIAQGMFARVNIFNPAKTNNGLKSVTIPYEALLDADGRTGYVFIPGANNRAKRVMVVIEEMRNDEVVISKGLEGVSRIILSGSAYLKEDSPFKITRTLTSTQ